LTLEKKIKEAEIQPQLQESCFKDYVSTKLLVTHYSKENETIELKIPYFLKLYIIAAL